LANEGELRHRAVCVDRDTLMTGLRHFATKRHIYRSFCTHRSVPPNGVPIVPKLIHVLQAYRSQGPLAARGYRSFVLSDQLPTRAAWHSNPTEEGDLSLMHKQPTACRTPLLPAACDNLDERPRLILCPA